MWVFMCMHMCLREGRGAGVGVSGQELRQAGL